MHGTNELSGVRLGHSHLTTNQIIRGKITRRAILILNRHQITARDVRLKETETAEVAVIRRDPIPAMPRADTYLDRRGIYEAARVAQRVQHFEYDSLRGSIQNRSVDHVARCNSLESAGERNVYIFVLI